MASPVKPAPLPLMRMQSIREATTTDGFKVMASKHHTYFITRGTLAEAVKNGYVDSHEAMMARTTKARHIAKEIMESKRRECNTLVDIKQQLIDVAKTVKAENAYIAPETSANASINSTNENLTTEKEGGNNDDE